MGSFWICTTLGISIMTGLLWTRRKKFGLNFVQTVVLNITLPIIGFAGSKLLYIVENYNQVLDSGNVGMSFFGTVFIIPIIMPLIGKLIGVPARKVLDICIPGGIAVLCCIRINCFIMGCCSGVLVFWFGTRFPLPIQLFEAIGDIWLLIQLLRWEKVSNPGGKNYPLFLVFYGTMRFLLEWLRVRSSSLLGMSHGHWFSLVAITIGVVALFFLKRGEYLETKR